MTKEDFAKLTDEMYRLVMLTGTNELNDLFKDYVYTWKGINDRIEQIVDEINTPEKIEVVEKLINF